MLKEDWYLLDCLRAVGKHEHITKAALELGSSQPALSRAISRLEARLGASLFERKGRSIHFTSRGRRLWEVVDRTFAELENAREELFASSDQKRRPVALGFLRTLGVQFVPGLVRRYESERPDVEFKFSQGNGIQIETELERGDLDLIFTVVPPRRPDVAWKKVADQEFVLIASATHPLARKRKLRLNEVAGERFVTFRSGHAVRKLLDNLCYEAGFQPKTSFECDDWSGIPGFVSAGLGVAIVPSDANWPSNVVALRTAQPLLRRPIGLAWIDNRFMHSTATAFRRLVLNEQMNANEALARDPPSRPRARNRKP